MMILGSPFADFRFDWPPPAELFISRSPMALYLFGWFLLPYFFVRPKSLWWILFLPLLVASAILVKSGVEIFVFYSARATPGRPVTLFLITLSVVTCAVQPIAVGLSRYFRSKKEPNQALEPTAMSVTSRAAHEPRQP
jgi:hypothetical protein